MIPVAAVTIAAVLLTVGIQAQRVVVVPPVGLNPLNQIIGRSRRNCHLCEKPCRGDSAGQGVFWDMQAGNDGMTACGTCHFHAGPTTG